MSKFVDGIKSLFSGTDNSAAEAEAAKQREQQSIALTKQTQDLQTQEDTQDENVGRATRQPRGRRLLLAATGEGGLSSKLNG